MPQTEELNDPINPQHYSSGFSNGAEVIDITENLPFNTGNAIKYLARAGRKDPSKHIEDLNKAEWYVQREIKRVSAILTENRGKQWQPRSTERYT